MKFGQFRTFILKNDDGFVGTGKTSARKFGEYYVRFGKTYNGRPRAA